MSIEQAGRLPCSREGSDPAHYSGAGSEERQWAGWHQDFQCLAVLSRVIGGGMSIVSHQSAQETALVGGLARGHRQLEWR